MNWNYFNTLGYVSVILWISIPLLWFVHSRMRPRRWLVHVALVIGIVALVLANINSSSHVERIQQDQTEQLAEIEAQKEARRQAALESRGEEVADIRFAEDGANDFLDRAGMDESDLKYMDKQLDDGAVPEWKKDKRERDAGGGEDADLEDLIGAEEQSEGVVSEELENVREAEPIIMSMKDKDMANRLDSLNIKAIQLMILLGLFFVVVDYLRRANSYREAYLPLPLPGSWTNAMSLAPAVVERPDPARRSMADELAWFTKRGETFLYLTDDNIKAGELPESLPKLGKQRWATDVIRVTEGGKELDREFVFESLWFGRASFVVNSASTSKAILDDIAERLRKRKSARARTRRTVHIVWDLSEPIPESTRNALSELAESTGFSLFLNSKSVQST